MPETESFDSIFARLKPILKKYEPGMLVKEDKPGVYYLDMPFSEKYKTARC